MHIAMLGKVLGRETYLWEFILGYAIDSAHVTAVIYKDDCTMSKGNTSVIKLIKLLN